MNRKSTSYIFTADINSASDMLQIEELRKAIKSLNTISDKKKRVVLRGRKPLVKMDKYNPYTGKMSTISYDWAGNIVGGIANATKIDVYVYNRS